MAQNRSASSAPSLGQQRLREHRGRARQQGPLAHLLELLVAARSLASAAAGSPASSSTIASCCVTAAWSPPISPSISSEEATSRRASSKSPAIAWSAASGRHVRAAATGLMRTSS